MNKALIYIGLLAFLKFSNCSDDKPSKTPSDDDEDDTEDLEALTKGLEDFKKSMGKIMADDELYRRRRHPGRRRHMLARRRRAYSEASKDPTPTRPPIPFKRSKSDTSDLDTPERSQPTVVYPPVHMVSESITGTPANSPERTSGATGGSRLFPTPKPITHRRQAIDSRGKSQLVRQRGFYDYEQDRGSGEGTPPVRRREFRYTQESEVGEDEGNVSEKQRYFDSFFEQEEKDESDSYQDADDEADKSIDEDVKNLAKSLSEKAKISESEGAVGGKEPSFDEYRLMLEREIEQTQEEEEDTEEDDEDRG